MGVAASHLSSRHRHFFADLQQGHIDEVLRAAEKNPNLLLRHHTLTRRENAIHVAVATGNAQLLSQLLRLACAALRCRPRGGALCSLLNASNDVRQTPLMLAALKGNMECAQLLLQHGADPWMVDASGGRTALHYAAMHDHADMMELLIDAGNLRRGKVAFPNCSNTSYINVRTLLGYTALHYAALTGAVDAARVLMAHDANIVAASLWDSWDSFALPAGSTPLHVAARMGHLVLAKALLQGHAEAWGSRQAPDPRLLVNSTGALPVTLVAASGHDALRHILMPSTPLTAIFTAEELRLYGPPKLQLLAAVALRAKLHASLDSAKRRQGAMPAAPAMSVHELACEGIQQQARHLADAKQQEKAKAGLAQGSMARGHPGADCGSSLCHQCDSSQTSALECASTAGAASPAVAADGKYGEPEPVCCGRGASSSQAVAQESGSVADHSSAMGGEDDSCNVCFEAAAGVLLIPCKHALCVTCCRGLLAMDYQDVPLCPFCRTPVGDFKLQPGA